MMKANRFLGFKERTGAIGGLAPRAAALALAGILALAAYDLGAQALSVFGGGARAQECFMNANMVADFASVSRNMLEPCDYAIEYVDLRLRDRAATYTNRGIILLAQGKYGDALTDYERAISMRPQAAEIYVNRGNAYYMMGDFQQALDDYQAAMELDIRLPHIVHYNRGMTLERLGDAGAAESAYRQALSLAPDWELAANRLANLLAGAAEQDAASGAAENPE